MMEYTELFLSTASIYNTMVRRQTFIITPIWRHSHLACHTVGNDTTPLSQHMSRICIWHESLTYTANDQKDIFAYLLLKKDKLYKMKTEWKTWPIMYQLSRYELNILAFLQKKQCTFYLTGYLHHECEKKNAEYLEKKISWVANFCAMPFCRQF